MTFAVFQEAKGVSRSLTGGAEPLSVTWNRGLWQFPGGQRLGLGALTAIGPDLIPDWETRIPQAMQPKE